MQTIPEMIAGESYLFAIVYRPFGTREPARILRAGPVRSGAPLRSALVVVEVLEVGAVLLGQDQGPDVRPPGRDLGRRLPVHPVGGPGPHRAQGLAPLRAGLADGGSGLMVQSDLGNPPWDVFHAGLSLVTPLSIGIAAILTSFGVLLRITPFRCDWPLGTTCRLPLTART